MEIEVLEHGAWRLLDNQYSVINKQQMAMGRPFLPLSFYTAGK